MTTQNIGLFKGLVAKMDYLDQRQRVLAQNIANADTPDYQPHDLVPVDFSKVLHEVDGKVRIHQETTHARHMVAGGELRDPENREKKHVYEVAPAKNAVIIEEQMIAAARTTMDYNLMTNLYQKNVNMIRTALGRGG